MQIAVLGIDLGKNSCSVVGLDAPGECHQVCRRSDAVRRGDGRRVVALTISVGSCGHKATRFD
jgi:hypothetical protein